MKKFTGIASILLGIIVFTTILDAKFFSPYNIMNLFRWTGLFGILSIGVGFVIMTGGIDLSVGSVVGFMGALSVNLLVTHSWSVPIVIVFTIAFSMMIGLVQGLLVTKVKIQSFVVTLTGLFIYRGLARFYTNDVTQGLGNGFAKLKFLVKGSIPADLFPNDSAPQFFKDWSLPMPF
ncbi:MAG: ABC transporter permease, partial [Rectinemataceae bacterium]|nr:ABC transporter permease [Rectinemataceae bacterium]